MSARVPRDRDPSGRARNARPRDRFGRPLPHGEAGVERIPDDFVLPPREALVEAQRLLDADLPFHAHEVLEGTWKATEGEQRQLWQGLAQLAVGLTHLQRGNRAGAAALLRRGAERIAPYAEHPPYEIDVSGLVTYAGTLAAAIDDGAEAAPAPPRLT
jgi:hypothetical protein